MNPENISTRYMCSILDNMRECYKTRNFSYLKSLIEEAQYRAERMESRIQDIQDMESYEIERIRLKTEIIRLRAERDKLQAGGGE